MTYTPTWMRTLRAHVERGSITRTARTLRYSRTTVSLVLAGKYRRDTRAIATRVRQVLIAGQRAQLRTLAPDIFLTLNDLIERWEFEIVAAMYGISETALRQLMRGTYKGSARRFVARVRALGFPEPEFCNECGHHVPCRRTTHEERPCA